jgi:hypothetical protein
MLTRQAPGPELLKLFRIATPMCVVPAILNGVVESLRTYLRWPATFRLHRCSPGGSHAVSGH